MATNLDVITGAFRKANITNHRETLSPAQSTAGLELLNDMMSDWEADGIELGYFPQTSLASVIPVQDEFLRGIKYNLARAVAGDNGADVSAEVGRIASLTLDRLAKATTEEFTTDFSHMPTGRNGFFDVTTG